MPAIEITQEELSNNSHSDEKMGSESQVKASISEIPNTDEEIIHELAPEIEKFGMIKMTIKVATNNEGVQYRWVVVRFDDTHDYNDFKHYIIRQKGSITIFGHLLEFKFLSPPSRNIGDSDILKRSTYILYISHSDFNSLISLSSKIKTLT